MTVLDFPSAPENQPGACKGGLKGMWTRRCHMAVLKDAIVWQWW